MTLTPEARFARLPLTGAHAAAGPSPFRACTRKAAHTASPLIDWQVRERSA